jgi:aryl-alcohol dehydrogenase-like predicted oxidoreductase
VEKSAIEKRKIGSLEVSLAGLGCNNFGWRIDADATGAVVDAALESGINFFDTADVYGAGQSEEFLGRALKGRRDQVLIATKFGMKMGEGKEGGKPAYVRQAAEDSLRRLGTDHIDLYQIHRSDPSTPIAETLGALTELVKAGKVREIGCSNFSATQLREASQVKGVSHFASVQNNYSLLHREPEGEVLPECQRLGIAFLPYFPLANGLLTGKYRKGQPFPKSSRAEDGFGPKIFTEENLGLVEELRSFAESRRHTLLELAMGWLASKAVIASIIAGAKAPEQVTANAFALAWSLSVDEMAAVNDILAGIHVSN